MIIGAYYRCPILMEPGDKEFPRFYMLGQAVEYNELSDGVVVKMHDLLNSSAYYADLLKNNVFPAKVLQRCEAMPGGVVSCKAGRGRIICRSRKGSETDQPFWYWIRLNSGKTIEFCETEIRLDYSQMNYGPEKQLRSYEFQHPTWFVNHMKVSKNLNIVNNAIYGFEVLAGCRAYLMPHQISTVARCFETMPIRYMLADEVGLGKTVEACSILSILRHRNRELKALVIAPGALVGQWKNELHYKYGLTAKEKSIKSDVCIMSLEDMADEWILNAISWDLVIVDETHRLLGQEQLYKEVQKVSQTATHLLLLSATPIQERNEEYRKLLALLSPEQYGKMTEGEFVKLVRKQSRIQKAVNQQVKRLPRYNEYYEEIIEKLTHIAEMLEDKAFNKLVSAINTDTQDYGLEAVKEALSYVCENYRIERRVIRNRRQLIRERMARRTLKAIPYKPLSLSENYNELSVIQDTMAYLVDHGDDESYVTDLAIPLLNALFSSPWAYLDMLKRLKINDSRLTDGAMLWAKQAKNEHRNANYILDEEPDLIKGRLLAAMNYIDQETDIVTDPTYKIVVFTSHTATLKAFAELFEKRFSSKEIYAVTFGAGIARDQLEEGVYLFQNDPNCRAIICDETGGEGRNFQNAKMVLHMDMPWNANALEQRIGRLDRLGRDPDEEVLSVVMYTKDTVEEQLFHIWRDSLKLFEESLSGLEIITGELNQLIVEALLDDYYFGLKNAFDDIMDQAEEMREAVEDEKDFDLGATLYSPMMDGVDRTLSLYEQEDGNLFAEAMMSWAAQAGLHARRGEDLNLIEFKHRDFSVNAARQSLLIPPDWSIYDNAYTMRREMKIIGTFDRGTASLREDILFFAPGDILYDAIISNALGCSRGRCSAIRTTSSFNYDGLIYIFNVEPQIGELLEAGIDLQTLSQYRMYLPQEQIIVPMPINAASKEIPESVVLEILNNLTVSNAKHLGKRSSNRFGYSAMERFIANFPPNVWEPLVDRFTAMARKKAMIKLKEEADIATAKDEMLRVLNGIRSECLYFGRSLNVVEDKKTIYNKTLKSLMAAKPVLDAVCYLRVRTNDK